MSLAELEAEAFILGKWKNFDDLEDSINLEELGLIIKALRKQEYERQKFAAALKGINLGDEQNDTEKKLEEVKRRAAAKVAGVDEDGYTEIELQEVGISFIGE